MSEIHADEKTRAALRSVGVDLDADPDALDPKLSACARELPPAWENYIDLADAKRWLRSPKRQTVDDDLMEECVDAACYWVQDHLSQPFVPTTFTRFYDGWSNWNGAYLLLPYFPVTKVVSVVEWWGASNHILAESVPEQQVDGYQIRPLTGRLTRAFPGNVQKPWFPGSANVIITWKAGYPSIPPNVTLATKMLIKYWYVNEQEASQSFGQHPESDSEPAAGGLWSAVPHRVTTLLQTYKRYAFA